MAEQPSLIPLAAGERLREEREKRRWSRARAAEGLKVPVDVVAAIEEGDLDRYAPVYRRGYLRSYARLLGFPEDDIAAMEAGAGADEPPPVRAVFAGRRAAPAGEKWLRVSGYVLATFLVGTLAWQLTYEATRLAGSEQNARVDGVSPPATGAGGADAQGNAPVNASLAVPRPWRQDGSPDGSGSEVAWRALNRVDPEETEQSGESLLRLTTSGESWVACRRESSNRSSPTRRALCCPAVRSTSPRTATHSTPGSTR